MKTKTKDSPQKRGLAKEEKMKKATVKTRGGSASHFEMRRGGGGVERKSARQEVEGWEVPCHLAASGQPAYPPEKLGGSPNVNFIFY